jgi:hypothetical protein
MIANFIRHEGCSELSESVMLQLRSHGCEIQVFKDQLPLPTSSFAGKAEALGIALYWYLEQAKCAVYFIFNAKRKFKNLSGLLISPLGFFATVFQILFGSKTREFLIARRVTSKHFAAIKASLERQPTAPIAIFEADALVEEAGVLEFLRLFSLQELSSPFDYLNLAGGYDPILNGASLLDCDYEGVQRILPPQSSTSCAYFLSCEYALELLEECLLRPRSLWLGIDHLHNKILRKTKKTAFIASPSPILHGSTSGLSKSWRD